MGKIQTKLDNLVSFLKDKNIEQAYISSYDSFLGEYVPPKNSLRVYLTNFTGSVAEVLINTEGRHQIFVDGRYTQQAGIQINSELFEICTAPLGQSVFSYMLKHIKSRSLAYIPERTSFKDFKVFKNDLKLDLIELDQKEIESIAGLDYKPNYQPIEWISPENGGVETQRKLQRLSLHKNEAYFVTALDALSWLVNGRGYHFPYLSSFAGSSIVTSETCYVFTHKNIPKSDAWNKIQDVKWINFEDTKDYHYKLLELLKTLDIFDLKFNPLFVNAADFWFLNKQCQLENLEAVNQLMTRYHSLKFAEEVHVMKDDFLNASKAIFETIKYTKNNWNKKSMSEKDVFNKTTEFYKKHGADNHSFKTIAGFAGNGSIIHYSSPDSNLALSEGEIFLLDSGAYFQSGFATDKTRTFLLGERVHNPVFKEIYTLVLKGLLQLQNYEFDEGASGEELDAIARGPLKAKGYDYAHGTGHGVGVHVHEGGVRIHMKTPMTMKAGQVVSIEPGIYLEGVAGVRLENIAHVVKDSQNGKLKFSNFVFIGFDHELIDESLLSEQEKLWLENYERQCQDLGTSFKYNN